MRAIWQDIQLGFRMLGKKPMVTLIGVVTLALGIGATTAVFTYLDQYLFHPYLYKDQDILVRVDLNRPNGRRASLSALDFLDIKRDNDVFDLMGGFNYRRVITRGANGTEEVAAWFVTEEMFPVLGVQPVLGRWFRPEEMQTGKDNVAILNYSYWRDRFAFDPQVLGKTVRLDDRIHTIVGVMPPSFFVGGRFYLPLVFTDEQLSEQARGARFMLSWAKLKPGVSAEEAQSQVSTIVARLAADYPQTNKEIVAHVFRPKDRDRKRFADQAAYYVLPAFFVILIVCANVAHLQLTRAADRQKEVAVRAAMGASRWRIARQFLIESVILAVIGGGLGILVAYVGLDAILAVIPDRSYSRLEYIAVDQNALYFAVGLSCVTGIVFCLAPALIGSKTKLDSVLKEGTTRASAATGGRRLRRVLIVSEIALTTVLLVGAGVMLRSLWQSARMQVGYDTSVITAYTRTISIQALRSRTAPPNPEEMGPKTVTFMDQALEKLRALPGVRSVAGASQASMQAGYEFAMPVQPASATGDEEDRTDAVFRFVTPDFFRTLSIPVLRGRVFDAQDGASSAPVAVISERLAKDLFPDRNPLGERIVRVRRPQEKEDPEPWQIVGIVGDIRWSPIPENPDPPELYVSFAQNPMPFVAFALRTDGGPSMIAKPVRETLLALNNDESVTGLTTLDEGLLTVIRRQSLFPAVMITFASIALLLAAVGIYGLTSYSVSQRTQELGILMVLGAQRGDIVGMVIRQGIRLGGLGIVLGALGSWGLIHVLQSELTEVQLRRAGLTSVDLTTCVAVVLFLGLVSVAANYLPARRATRVDPMTALRYE